MVRCGLRYSVPGRRHRESCKGGDYIMQKSEATKGLGFLRLYSYMLFDGHLRTHAKESTCTSSLLLCKVQQKQ